MFAYRLAVTRLRTPVDGWSADPTIVANLAGSTFGVLTLEDMWSTVLAGVTMTPAASEMGRLAQLLKAAGLRAPEPGATPKDRRQEVTRISSIAPRKASSTFRSCAPSI
jgi:hypothetical protein